MDLQALRKTFDLSSRSASPSKSPLRQMQARRETADWGRKMGGKAWKKPQECREIHCLIMDFFDENGLNWLFGSIWGIWYDKGKWMLRDVGPRHKMDPVEW